MTNVLVEKSGGVTRVALNRPPLNILDISMMQELVAALDAVRADSTSKIIVLAAQGKLFSAGVDIKDHTADRVEQMLSAFHALIRTLRALEQPTVAAVQGSALGGGMELALACDFIVASARAKFALPEIQVGVFPPIAALALPRLMPRKKAFELLLTGDAIDANTAERLGLANVVAPADCFEEAANTFVTRLTRCSGAVLRLTKRAAQIPLGGENEKASAEIEHLYLDELMRTADAQEGLAAFMEKRAPVWKEK